MSRWYDWISGPYERRWMLAALQALAVQPGESVLEVGPGTGHALLALAQSTAPRGRVCGLDLSTGMLHAAQRRLKDSSARVALHCGDATRLPYASRTFDALFMSFTLELFAAHEIPAVMHECRRVLRPGGRLGVVGMSTGRPGATGVAAMVAAYKWLHQAFPRVVDCRPIDVCAAVAAAGFEVRQAQVFSMFGLPGEQVIGHAKE